MCDKQYRFRPGSQDYYNLGLYHVVNDNSRGTRKESAKLTPRSSRRRKKYKITLLHPLKLNSAVFCAVSRAGHLRGEFAGVVICIARV